MTLTIEETIEAGVITAGKADDLVAPYAAALQRMLAGHPVDWPRINNAILARWARSTLVRIKRAAWAQGGAP